METICGADCTSCAFKSKCKGCIATCGSPFGGRCVAAEYIKAGGREGYARFKKSLLEEVNAVLASADIPPALALYELPGFFVNLEYTTPGGEKVKLLNDRNVYLGAQIDNTDIETCFGVVADTGFILVCSYGEGGSDPELLIYKKR